MQSDKMVSYKQTNAELYFTSMFVLFFHQNMIRYFQTLIIKLTWNDNIVQNALCIDLRRKADDNWGRCIKRKCCIHIRANLQNKAKSKNGRGRSFFGKPFFRKFVVTPPPDLLKHVRLGQVRQAIKSSKIGPLSFLSPFFKFQKINSRKGVTPEGLGDERTD